MDNVFYLFSRLKNAYEVECSIPFKNYISYTAVFNEQQCKRLLGNTELVNEKIIVWACNVHESNQIITSVENGSFYRDCNKDICRFLDETPNVYGYSSLKMNDIISTILLVNDNSITGLKGDNGWESLVDLFNAIKNADVEYLVLRKYETLPQSYLEGDHDIDILCSSIQQMIMVTGARKRNIGGISAYYLTVANERTDFDIRFVGDGYFDAAWERSCLNSRILNKTGISVMDDENQLFTILYHCFTQKKSFSDYYKNEIRRLIYKVFSDDKDDKCEDNEDSWYRLLIAYMKTHSYYHVKPLDVSVIQNKEMIRRMDKDIFAVSKLKNIIMRFWWFIPGFIRTHFVSSKMRQYTYEIR